MNYFISVNYNTSYLIQEWANRIRENCKNCKLIIIDNYFSDDERIATKKACEALSIDLLPSENIGYGAALNIGIRFVLESYSYDTGVIFAGNLDIEYLKIPASLPDGKLVYVPRVKEAGRQNRNPFLTKFQSRFLWTYIFAARYNSVVLYFASVALNKLLSLIPSRIWAVHGSVFCFNLQSISLDLVPFNDSSFLYGEELEFASFMEKQGAEFFDSEITVKHASHVATKTIISSHSEFLSVWAPSFLNWHAKWN